MIDLTVRKVATFLREPWWISICIEVPVSLQCLSDTSDRASSLYDAVAAVWERGCACQPRARVWLRSALLELDIALLRLFWGRRQRTWITCLDNTMKVTAMCERSFVSLPLGPSTVTRRERMATLTFSGTVIVSTLFTNFMLGGVESMSFVEEVWVVRW